MKRKGKRRRSIWKSLFGSSLIFQQDKHTASPEKVFLRITNTIKCHQSWTGLPLPEPNIREAVWNRLDRKWNKINIQRGALNIVQEAWTPISEDCLKKWQADKELRLSLRINVVIQTIDFVVALCTLFPCMFAHVSIIWCTHLPFS